MRPQHSDPPNWRDCRRPPASRRRRQAVEVTAAVAAVVLIGVLNIACFPPLRVARRLGSGGSQPQQQVDGRQRSYRRVLLTGSLGAHREP